MSFTHHDIYLHNKHKRRHTKQYVTTDSDSDSSVTQWTRQRNTTVNNTNNMVAKRQSL